MKPENINTHIHVSGKKAPAKMLVVSLDGVCTDILRELIPESAIEDTEILSEFYHVDNGSNSFGSSSWDADIEYLSKQDQQSINLLEGADDPMLVSYRNQLSHLAHINKLLAQEDEGPASVDASIRMAKMLKKKLPPILDKYTVKVPRLTYVLCSTISKIPKPFEGMGPVFKTYDRLGAPCQYDAFEQPVPFLRSGGSIWEGFSSAVNMSLPSYQPKKLLVFGSQKQKAGTESAERYLSKNKEALIDVI